MHYVFKIRRGAVGKAEEDGMTPELSALIRGILEAHTKDEAAVRWIYQGGLLD